MQADARFTVLKAFIRRGSAKSAFLGGGKQREINVQGKQIIRFFFEIVPIESAVSGVFP
jgi:hypothetical protein